MIDVLVIGDGIIGRSIAYACAKTGYQTAILTEQNQYSATHSAGGMLTPSAEIETAQAVLMQFAQESCAKYPEFVGQIEDLSGEKCEYIKTGTLMLALHRDHQNDLRYLAEAQRAVGMQVQELNRREVLQKEPNLSPQVVGALYAENDHCLNPRALHAALGHALQTMQVTTTKASSIQLHPSNNRLDRVSSYQEQRRVDINAKHVIVCAGAWTNKLLPTPISLPSKPIKGQFVRLQGPPLIDQVVRTPDVYLIPRAHGEIYVGASTEDQGFNSNQTAGAIMELLYHSWRAAPGTYEMNILEQGVGFRPSLRDNLPAIGKTAIEGLLVATGHYRHGIMLAPQTNDLILDILAEKPNPYAKAFCPQRFGPTPLEDKAIQEVA